MMKIIISANLFLFDWASALRLQTEVVQPVQPILETRRYGVQYDGEIDEKFCFVCMEQELSALPIKELHFCHGKYVACQACIDEAAQHGIKHCGVCLKRYGFVFAPVASYRIKLVHWILRRFPAWRDAFYDFDSKLDKYGHGILMSLLLLRRLIVSLGKSLDGKVGWMYAPLINLYAHYFHSNNNILRNNPRAWDEFNDPADNDSKFASVMSILSVMILFSFGAEGD